MTCAHGCSGPSFRDDVLDLQLCVPCHVREHCGAQRVDLVVPAAVATLFVLGADSAVRQTALTISDPLCDGQWRDLMVVRLNALHAISKVARTQEQLAGPLRLNGSWRTLAAVLQAAVALQVAVARRAIATDDIDLERAERLQEAAEALNHLFYRVRAQRRLVLRHETEVSSAA